MAQALSPDPLARENRSLEPAVPLPEESLGGSPLADHFEAPGLDGNIARCIPGDDLDRVSGKRQLTARIAQPVGASVVGEGSSRCPIQVEAKVVLGQLGTFARPRSARQPPEPGDPAAGPPR